MTALTVAGPRESPDNDQVPAPLSGGPPVESWLDVPSWRIGAEPIRHYQRRLERQTPYVFRLAKAGERNSLRCPARWTSEYRRLEAVKGAYRLLGFRAKPSDEELDWALAQAGILRSRSPRRSEPGDNDWYRCRKMYFQRYSGENDLQQHSLRTRAIVLATPGTPDRPDKFRSQWERRLASALDRLGIRWDYESDWFYYRDWRGQQRRYIPDFQLVDFTNTFVEVKGPSGPDEADRIKMQRVLITYPKLTLVLWDASLVEYIEDLQEKSAVIGLLQTTDLRRAAA